MIADIGILTGKRVAANALISNISKAFKELPTAETAVKTAYLIWRKPYMTVGGDTFINNMVLQCGFENVFAGKLRYPQITIEDLRITNCQLLLLSSEPYPFQQKHIDELSDQLPHVKIMLADGEFFSWYGSRLLQSPAYFRELITKIESK